MIAYVDDMEKAIIKIRTFIDKISRAAYGHSGLFDAVKINEKELEKIYTFDLAFFDVAAQISSGLDNVASGIGGEGLKAALRSVNDLALLAVETYDKRYQTLTGSAETQQ
jgi:hypothetical protein